MFARVVPEVPMADMEITRVRAAAKGILVLGRRNASVQLIEIDTTAPQNTVSVIGTDLTAKRRGVILEVGIGHGNPWGWFGGKYRSWRSKYKRHAFHVSPSVRDALLGVVLEIARRKMAHWQSGGFYTTRRTVRYKGGRNERKRKITIRTGIRFAFHPLNADLIDFLRWHEIIWSESELHEYVAYRAIGIRRRLESRSLERWERGTRNKHAKAAAAKLLRFFDRSQRLRDPYVQTVLIPMLFPKHDPIRRPHPKMQILEDLGVIGPAFYRAWRRRPRAGMLPSLGMHVRYVGIRQNGNVVFEISALDSASPSTASNDDVPF